MFTSAEQSLTKVNGNASTVGVGQISLPYAVPSCLFCADYSLVI